MSPTILTFGSGSARGYGITIQQLLSANYIEDVFSTNLYTGSNNLQVISADGASINNQSWSALEFKNTSGVWTTIIKTICDSAGNFYAVGRSSDGTNIYAFVAKFNSSLVLQWQRRYGTGLAAYADFNALAIDTFGNVIVVGGVTNTGMVIVKYNSSGVLQWQRKLAQATNSYATGVTTDTSNNIYVVGYDVAGSTGYASIAKYDSAGTIQWKSYLQNTNFVNYPTSINIDTSGNIFISGSYNTAAAPSWFPYISKLNSSGTVQWTRIIYKGAGNSNYMSGCSSVLDSAGNIFLHSFSDDSQGVGGISSIIAKYNTSGALQWTVGIPFYYGIQNCQQSIAIDSNNNLYTSTTYRSNALNGATCQVSKFNSSGTLLWNNIFYNSSGIYADCICVDTSNVFVSFKPQNLNSNLSFIAVMKQDGSINAGSITSTIGYPVLNAYKGGIYNITPSGWTDAAGVLTSGSPSNTDAAISITDTDNTWTITQLVRTLRSQNSKSTSKILSWIKNRSSISTSHILTDNLNGPGIVATSPSDTIGNALSSDTDAALTNTSGTTNDIVMGIGDGSIILQRSTSVSPLLNSTSNTYVSWTFSAAPNFFDMVTGTCDSSGNITVNHSLGSAPGFAIIKRTDGVSAWFAYHRSLGNSQYLYLNATNAAGTLASIWNSTATTFTANLGFAAGSRVVVYLFAHNAGGFGLTGTDNVISCGSFTTDASGNASVTLGYEPQWLLYKRTDAVGNWIIADSMRGFAATDYSPGLIPNLSNAESPLLNAYSPTATGFQATNGRGTVSSTYIYIAIRRDPMKTPTSGAQVFTPVNYAGGSSASSDSITTGFPVDLIITQWREAFGAFSQTNNRATTRLTGLAPYLNTQSTNAETSSSAFTSFNMNGMTFNNYYTVQISGTNPNYINLAFRRAPGFFDVVCYTGTGVARTVNHNLGVVPEMMIVKDRTSAQQWVIYHSAVGNTKSLAFNTAIPSTSAGFWNNTTPTSSVFSTGGDGGVNGNSDNYVAYLFASCPGVSKVGSYTGNGTNQTINCGFTGGARFVLIKRTDSTGDWYVWDTARGIIPPNDPHLSLNTAVAEVTTDDSIDADNSGFIVNQVAATNINVSTATYIFLAIA